MIDDLLRAEQIIIGSALVSIMFSAASLVYAEVMKMSVSRSFRSPRLRWGLFIGVQILVLIELASKLYFFTSFLSVSPYRTTIYDEESILPETVQYMVLGEYLVFFVALNVGSLLLIFFSWAAINVDEARRTKAQLSRRRGRR